MDIGEHTFALWNSALAEQCMCYFDVRPLEFIQLNKGVEALIEGFLRCLSIGGKPLNWTITPFCSPYFSGAGPGNNYLDRYPIAWRVSVRVLKPSYKARLARTVFSPCVCGGDDPSWKGPEDSWNWTERRCVVIADMPEQRWPKALCKLQREPVFASCRALETFCVAAGFLQARFDLGVLKFPGDSACVDAFVESCKAQSASVNWATSLRIAQG